jgi:molybdopterin converting factor small subunit
MIVNVEYLTTIREITKKHVEKIELEEKATVGDLVSKLIGLYGSSFKEIIFPQGSEKVGVHLAILVEGKDFRLLDDLNTRLNDGNTLMVATIAMGG